MKTKSLTKFTLLSIFVMTLIAAVTLNSCQKEVTKKTILSSKALKSTNRPTATVSLLLNDANNMVFSISKSKGERVITKTAKGLMQNFNFMDTTGGAIITFDTLNKPDSIVADYGTGCTGLDGNTRSGIVVITYDFSDIRVINNAYTIYFQNYSIYNAQTGANAPVDTTSSSVTVANGNATSAPNINGSISFTNIGPGQDGNLVIQEYGNYTSAGISATNTVTLNYNYDWITGESSSPLSDLQFSITGSAIGTSTDGTMDTSMVTSPVTKNCKNQGCNFYISGTVYKNSSNAQYPTYLDYGNPGGCTGQVAVTVNGVTTIKNQ